MSSHINLGTFVDFDYTIRDAWSHFMFVCPHLIQLFRTIVQCFLAVLHFWGNLSFKVLAALQLNNCPVLKRGQISVNIHF